MDLDLNNVSISDLIGLIVVIGGLFLLAEGIDGTVGTIMIAVVGFYFGNKVRNGLEKDRQRPKKKTKS